MWSTLLWWTVVAAVAAFVLWNVALFLLLKLRLGPTYAQVDPDFPVPITIEKKIISLLQRGGFPSPVQSKEHERFRRARRFFLVKCFGFSREDISSLLVAMEI